MNSVSRPLWVLLLCAIAQSAACGDSRTDEQKYADALANIEAGAYRAATIDLRNLLQANPGNLEARLALGKAALRLGDVEAAEKEFQRAKELGAAPDDYGVPLARALLQRNAFAELIAEVRADGILDPAIAAEVQALRGNALIALDSVADAQREFDAVIAAAASPEAVRLALLGKAEIAKRGRDLAGAEAFVRRSLESVPDSAESMLALGQLLTLQQKLPEAEEAFLWGRDNLTTSTVNSYLLGAGLVEAQLGQNKIDEAADSARFLVENNADHPLTGYLLGRIAFQGNKNAEAIEHLSGVIDKYPEYTVAKALLGAAYLRSGNFDQAELYLSAAVQGDPSNSMARGMLAEARLKLDRPGDAAATARDGLRNDSDNAGLLAMLGQASLSQGDYEAGVRYLRESLDANPGNPQVLISLASAYIATGETDTAIKIIESIPEGAIDEARRRGLLITSRLKSSPPGQVEADTDQLVSEFPDDTSILSFAGSMYIGLGNVDKARKSLIRVLELEPDNRAAMMNLGKLDDDAGDYSISRKYFEAMLKRHPEDLMTIMALARIAVAQNDQGRADQLFERAMNAHPDELLPQLAMATRAMERRDFDTAERLTKAAVSAHPRSPAAHGALGLNAIHRADWNTALDSLRKATELEPGEHRYRFMRASVEQKLGREDAALLSFREAWRLDTSHLRTAQILIELETRLGNNDAVDKILNVVRRDNPNAPRRYEIEGDVAKARSQIGNALKAWERAHAAEPSGMLARKIYRARKSQRLADPVEPLWTWLEGHQDDAATRMLLAQELHNSNDSDAAIAQYEEVLRVQPRNPIALNNVAWLYFEKPGDDARSKALAASKKAFDLVPNNGSIADTYGWILVKSGRVEDGKKVLADALAASTPAADPDLAFHLAAALQEQGQRSRAKELLAAALGSKAPFASRDEARRLYESL